MYMAKDVYREGNVLYGCTGLKDALPSAFDFSLIPPSCMPHFNGQIQDVS